MKIFSRSNLFGKKSFLKAAVALAAFLYGMVSPVPAAAVTVKGAESVMGTTLSVEIQGNSEQAMRSALQGIFKEVQILDKLLSPNDPQSDISLLARRAPEWVKVSPQTIRALLLSRQWALRTEGAFEPTIGPLVKLWGFDTGHLHVPTSAEFSRVLALLDYNEINIDLGGLRARLAKRGAAIDLDPIDKGFALDEIQKWLEKNPDITSAFLNFGGEVLYWDRRESTISAQRITIQDPSPLTNADAKSLGEFQLVQPAAVSTVANSGGSKARVLNPKTGMPAEGIESVTVIANDATSADALSTALFVMGRDKGIDFVNSLAETAAIIFYRDEAGHRHWVSSSLWSTLAQHFKINRDNS